MKIVEARPYHLIGEPVVEQRHSKVEKTKYGIVNINARVGVILLS